LLGTLTVSSSDSVVLQIGNCSQQGSLVESGSSYKFVPSTTSGSSTACSATTISSVSVAVGNNNQLSVVGTVNGQQFSSAASPEQSSAQPTSPTSSTNVGIIVGPLAAFVVICAVAFYVYKRNAASNAGTGQSGGSSTTSAAYQDRNVAFPLNEEMLANIATQYNHYPTNDRDSIQGDTITNL